MTERELTDMFGDIPVSGIIAHRWRVDPALTGIVSAGFIHRISSHKLSDALRATVNRRIFSEEFDPIVSLGQVLLHEVVGMSNYSRSVLVCAGGE